MWTLKSTEAKLNTKAQVPGERMMLHVKAILTNGTEDVEIPFVIENKRLMDDTLLSILDRMNGVASEVIKIQSGEGYTPEPKPTPETPTPPTAEELAKEAYTLAKEALIEAKLEYDLGLIGKSEYDALIAETKKVKKV